MYPRLEGEVAKLIKIENGYNVVIWDPETPKPVEGVPPCTQQPVRFWKTFSFKTLHESLEFIRDFLRVKVDAR